MDQVLINLHGGWSASHGHNEIEIARVRASMTGLTRYLDTNSKLLDSRKSPEAVRALLDQALKQLNLPGAASDSATQA